MKQLPFIVMIVTLMFGLAGCSTYTQVNRSEQRYWTSQYEEILKITTEPVGSRVYVQDKYIGISPVEVPVEGGETKIIERGTYKVNVQIAHDLFVDRRFDRGRATGTEWSGLLSGSIANQTFEVEAFKEGYQTATENVILSDSSVSFKKAIDHLKPSSDGKLPLIVKGYRNVLIALVRSPNADSELTGKPQQQQQQQQQTVVFPGVGGATDIARGLVMVTSTPENAEIFTDGAFVGNAPATLKLSEGIHIIEVKIAGFKSYRKELRVIGSSELRLRVGLKKE